MELHLLAKDDKSGHGGCPAVYLGDTGELVVQGAALDPADLAKLDNPLPGETAVRIAPEVVRAALELYQQRRA